MIDNNLRRVGLVLAFSDGYRCEYMSPVVPRKDVHEHAETMKVGLVALGVLRENCRICGWIVYVPHEQWGWTYDRLETGRLCEQMKTESFSSRFFPHLPDSHISPAELPKLVVPTVPNGNISPMGWAKPDKVPEDC